MIKKTLISLITTMILITGAIASDVLYVKEPHCFVTDNVSNMEYIFMLKDQKDFVAFGRAMGIGVASGEIVLLPVGKKVFFIRTINEYLCAIRPEGSPQIFCAISCHFAQGETWK